jgi:hypothetical protein
VSNIQVFNVTAGGTSVHYLASEGEICRSQALKHFYTKQGAEIMMGQVVARVAHTIS